MFGEQYPTSMFGDEDDIECDYDDDYLMLTAPSNLMAEQPRVQETGRVSYTERNFQHKKKSNFYISFCFA